MGRIPPILKRILASILALALALTAPGLPCYAARSEATPASDGGKRLDVRMPILGPVSGGLSARPPLQPGLSLPPRLISPDQTVRQGAPVADAPAPAPAERSRAAEQEVRALHEAAPIKALLDPGQADKDAALRLLFQGEQARDSDLRTPVTTAAEFARARQSPPLASSSKTSAAAAGAPRPVLPEAVRAEGRAGLKTNSLLIKSLGLLSFLGSGLFYSALGLPFTLGLAAPMLRGAAQKLLAPYWEEDYLRSVARSAKRKGGWQVTENNAPKLFGEIKKLAQEAGISPPVAVFLMPEFRGHAMTQGLAGGSKTILLVDFTFSRKLLDDPRQRVVLAHEVQHMRDLLSPWLAAPHFVRDSLLLAGLAFAVNLGLAALGLPAWDYPGLFRAATAIVLGIPAHAAIFLVHFCLLESRADMGARALTGDGESLESALGSIQSSRSRRTGLRLLERLASITSRFTSGLGGMELHFPTPSSPAPALADDDPKYYSQPAPDWVKRLSLDGGKQFAGDKRQLYKEEIERLRPLARWMAHFFVALRDANLQRPPNLLTIQDVLNWVIFVKKFESKGGYILGTAKGAVVEGARAMFQKTLPAKAYEGRKLQREFEVKLKEAMDVLEKLPLPKHLTPLSPKAAAEPEEGSSEFIEESPALFEAGQVEGLSGPDYILTKTVRERLEDLIRLYSEDHRLKFFPLLIGDTAEGKSSLIKYMFALPALKNRLERSVPVIAIPVKEAMTRRELLGGKSARGIELGFLSMAAKNGWVLVLEELNQASGEFRKSLNDVLHQIRKQGYFEFEVGGKTVRVKAHPHFWVVGTENPDEGNFAFSRNPDSPDFLKRWVVRRYEQFPPAEQAEIMHGLAVLWYKEKFVQRHGLSLNFFEQVVTQFHEPLRRQAASGKLGGDNQEPYEFNRRTLHRFLKRYLNDLFLYESKKKPLDEKARRLLLARELMEAYGTEVRQPGERQAIWAKMNIVFELKKNWNIDRSDIAIEVTGFHPEGQKLVAEEKLVPLEFPIRANGGARVPGPEHRLTLVPSLAENVYRYLRNRQFGEHQFSTGPTGTAKTSAPYFVNHMLGEPVFGMTLDEQTPMSEFHGGYLKDPATGEFIFLPGVLARAMMHDPQGLLKKALTASEVRKSPHIGATLVINEGNASPIIETINPALDDGILHLSDGQHSAVAGAGFHVAVTLNPVGEGYAGYPLTGALKSRGQTVHHAGDMSEEELTEIILDQLTGFTRHELREPQ